MEKVKIALAISIIRNTPPGKTASEYANELRKALNEQWHNGLKVTLTCYENTKLREAASLGKLHNGSLKYHQRVGLGLLLDIYLVSDDDPFEDRTVGRLLVERMHLKNQQRAVTTQLSSLIPSSSRCNSNPLDSGYSSCEVNDGMDADPSSLFSEYEKPLDFSEDIRETLRANLDFIRGIVRLKDLLGDDEVVGDRFDSIMREVQGPTPESLKDSESETDTQNTGVVCSKVRSNYTVASGVVQYALQTTGAEMIVKKSVQEIHRHLCAIALDCSDLSNTISNWEGSLLQYSAAVIRRLAEEKNFQKAIMISTGGLATVVISEMMKNYGLEKNVKMENQVAVLLQLCENSVICSEVLKIVTEKINVISAKYKVLYQSESSSTPMEKTIFCENTYYIFYLTEKLLTRYFKMQQKCQSPPEHNLQKRNEERKITDLWRGAWEKNGCKPLQNEPGEYLRERQGLIKSWCVSLENAAKVFSFNYPLLTIYANNCIEIINGNQKKSPDLSQFKKLT